MSFNKITLRLTQHNSNISESLQWRIQILSNKRQMQHATERFVTLKLTNSFPFLKMIKMEN